LEAVRISRGDEVEAKAAYVRELGAERVIALGQGTNDAGMLQEAEVGICVLSQESSAVEALMAADLVVPDIHAALELLEYPMRLVASLRR
jgi:P-type E1-E2 ATPase